MKAKDPAQFNAAWQHHIDQLASLALAADIPYNDFTTIKQELENWLTEATAKFERTHNG